MSEVEIEGKEFLLECGCKKPILSGRHVHCPKCGSPPSQHEVRNYDEMWRDGDVHCTKCEAYVRDYDAG